MKKIILLGFTVKLSLRKIRLSHQSELCHSCDNLTEVVNNLQFPYLTLLPPPMKLPEGNVMFSVLSVHHSARIGGGGLT